MVYDIVRIAVYIFSVFAAMIGLSCFDFGRYMKKSKVREFYVFYIVTSIALGYLFASFILTFASVTFYS